MTKAAEVVQAVKGFNPDMTCNPEGNNPFQYAIGKTYTMKGNIEACSHGFHACHEHPLAVFGFYAPGLSVYANVEQSGKLQKHDDKCASSVLTVKAALSLAGLASAAVEYTLSRVKHDKNPAATNTGDQSAATNTGDQSAATNTGDQSAATNTGYQSAATNTGYQSAATNTGNRSAATNTGNRSAATNTGDQSAATNTGYQSAATNTGEHGVALAVGLASKAMAAKTGAIVVAWWDARAARKRYTVGYVGEDGIKPNVFYTADDNGKLVAA